MPSVVTKYVVQVCSLSTQITYADFSSTLHFVTQDKQTNWTELSPLHSFFLSTSFFFFFLIFWRNNVFTYICAQPTIKIPTIFAFAFQQQIIFRIWISPHYTISFLFVHSIFDRQSPFCLAVSDSSPLTLNMLRMTKRHFTEQNTKNA